MKIFKLIVLVFPLLYIGCGESENNHHETSVESSPTNEVAVSKESKEQLLLKELGFDFQNQKISIDINKTTNFLKKMEIEMHGKADEIQHKIEKADINFTRDIGLMLEGEKVSIDLNKTKKMFQEINILMKEVLLDKNSSKS
ncbi:MAG: Unknown protein [uncultured Sulfurovum sp.]|uniref:Uncharacterized protein n=1 Tax=uncultured Sulfurovum sp. TaxID=269237 RepID=A0A6S6SGE4_9BACT|nr:MAG: Unknown protein [uncultured Sulfurovum sp.]